MHVHTVTGAVDVEALGTTLVHEHLYVGHDGWQLDPRHRYDREELITQASERLGVLADLGVTTFVDPCPIELGRDVTLMAEVSRRSGVRIVCTTGFYYEGRGIPTYWQLRTADEIAELFTHELTRGIADTGIRAGAIKVATGGQEPTPLEEKLLVAAATAHEATGAPIITHTQDGIGGPQQQAVFAREGVAPHRCLIGHSCGNPDPAYHRRIVEAGSYVGFDRIGYAEFQSDEVRADNLVHLLRGGHADRVLISQDRYCGFLGAPSQRAEAARAEHLRSGGGPWPPPHTYLFTDFLPMLRQRGVTDVEIAALLTDNPRRFFSGEIASEGGGSSAP